MRALVVLLLLAPMAAHAQEVLGIGPRAAGLGGAVSARTGDIGAAYYGPASLPDPDDAPGFAELELGYLHASPQLTVEAMDPAQPIEVLPTGAVNGIWVGARFDLGVAFDVEGLAVGLSLYVPGRELFRWRLRPDDTPQWLTWTDRTQHLSIFAGLGWRITPWLSLGVGAQVLFDVQTFTTALVSTIERGTDPETGEPIVEVDAQLGTDVTVFGRAAPTASVLLAPHPRLNVSIAYRGEIYVDDRGWTRLDGTPGLGAIGYVHRFAHYYQPHQLTLGTAVLLGEVELSADLTYNRWAKGRTPNARELGEGRYGDTLVPALGASWSRGPGALWLGYRYVRAHFTNASGPTNLLETDQHVASIGGELRLERWFPAFPLRVRLAYQTIVLPEETETKDWQRFSSESLLESNAGYPGYRHRGWVPSLWLSVGAVW